MAHPRKPHETGRSPRRDVLILVLGTAFGGWVGYRLVGTAELTVEGVLIPLGLMGLCAGVILGYKMTRILLPVIEPARPRPKPDGGKQDAGNPSQAAG